MPRLLRAALLLCASAVLPSCTALDALNATVPTAGLTIARDLPYGPGARQRMDVYRADNRAGPLPVVVFFYGGAWQDGDKRDYLFVAASLARRGSLVMVPDYRVYPQVRFPRFVEDAAAAVAYARRVAPSWGGDPQRLFLVGHSAGAYLAVMLALDPAYLAAAGDSRNALAGVVGIAGPYDFLPIRGADIRAVFSSAADLRVTQPINHVDGHNPPLLLLFGAADTTVYPRNSLALASRVRAAGGPVEVKEYNGAGHIGIMLGFAPPPLRRGPPVPDDIASFVAQTPQTV